MGRGRGGNVAVSSIRKIDAARILFCASKFSVPMGGVLMDLLDFGKEAQKVLNTARKRYDEKMKIIFPVGKRFLCYLGSKQGYTVEIEQYLDSGRFRVRNMMTQKTRRLHWSSFGPEEI
jgi:hypothetical protein